jgi:hypothetical protein
MFRLFIELSSNLHINIKQKIFIYKNSSVYKEMYTAVLCLIVSYTSTGMNHVKVKQISQFWIQYWFLVLNWGQSSVKMLGALYKKENLGWVLPTWTVQPKSSYIESPKAPLTPELCIVLYYKY